ncbi:hypothetical protein [Fusibacter ferrireducens]|uniref:DUF5067 domain-containing protein n=1 Tax=Fusibacter ferrireducens TaxID=2785058 RepID=A0ABR9ZUV0_9FIRM|nr:hypothetical protein [Fusibacter ferrireducens]MBF4694240.1 hypothetical protein [Fusibacter ferrireducens]
MKINWRLLLLVIIGFVLVVIGIKLVGFESIKNDNQKEVDEANLSTDLDGNIEEDQMNSIKSDQWSKHLFFTQWKAYAGYALYEKKGSIQIPLIDANGDDFNLTNVIQEIDLKSNKDQSKLLELRNYTILKGTVSEDGKDRILTLKIDFDLKSVESIEFNEIMITFRDGGQYTWDI